MAAESPAIGHTLALRAPQSTHTESLLPSRKHQEAVEALGENVYPVCACGVLRVNDPIGTID